MENLATQLIELKKNIILVYAFNGTGKTRLSVAYKDVTKNRNEGKHSGVYYNAYSEDLFVWDNDEENDGENVRLLIQKSTLNQYHSLLNEDILREKLAPYNPKYDFEFKFYDNPEEGIESVQFFIEKGVTDESSDLGKCSGTTRAHVLVDNNGNYLVDGDNSTLALKIDEAIKISRGEERIFIWCFFLALFEVDDWASVQNTHLFIDDPVSSLDDHNIFVTALSILGLIERHYENRKIILTTHHFGLISFLYNWLMKGEKKDLYKNQVQTYILKKNDSVIQFVSSEKDVLLYHLEIMQILKKAIDNNMLYTYHFALLRQVLENLSSFLGSGRFSFVLEKIGYTDAKEIAQIVNYMTHKDIFLYETNYLPSNHEQIIKEVFSRIQSKYNFVLHA